MGNTPLILHQYDISPFSQKAQKMMGLKGLSWQSVEMPMERRSPMSPGGYRGTPVLQSDGLFIDNWMIARADAFDPVALRSMHRGPLREAALYAWGERLFTPLLHAWRLTKSEWDADFLADRKRVFPDVDFDALDVQTPSAAVRCRGPVESSGQDFLGGKQADGWDIHVWGMVWMIQSAQ